MAIDKIHDYTDAYLESYLRALDKTHNPDSGHPDSDGCHYGFKNDRRAERTEAASSAADQSTGGTFRSHDAAGGTESAGSGAPGR